VEPVHTKNHVGRLLLKLECRVDRASWVHSRVCDGFFARGASRTRVTVWPGGRACAVSAAAHHPKSARSRPHRRSNVGEEAAVRTRHHRVACRLVARRRAVRLLRASHHPCRRLNVNATDDTAERVHGSPEEFLSDQWYVIHSEILFHFIFPRRAPIKPMASADQKAPSISSRDDCVLNIASSPSLYIGHRTGNCYCRVVHGGHQAGRGVRVRVDHIKCLPPLQS